MKHCIVIIAAVALFGGASCSKKKETAVVETTTDPVAVLPIPEPPVEPATPPVPEAPKLPERFDAPAELAIAIAGELEKGHLENAISLIGADKLETASAYGFEHLFTAGDYGINPANPQNSVGEINGRHRFALNLVSEADPTLREKILLDLIPHAKKGWAVDAVHTPETLRSVVRAAGIPEPPSDPPTPGAVNPAAGPDSLMKAESFLSSVLTQNYEAAVALCDPMKVPEEKIAAMCIVFEEGEYRMKEDRPLMTTGIGDDSSWVIAQVESDLLKTKSDFGMEMQKTEGVWKIVGLNFSKMLSEYAAASDAGKVPYSPIVKNPKGGESLVLYFEYDESGVGARTQKQIDILARILRADTTKTLSISGHADANGTDEYNNSLSGKRAAAVKIALIAAGVPEAQIVTQAMGESNPLRPNLNPDGTDNPEGRGHNRRAEVYLNF
jgi:OOP family OmpA-OmpF porin